MVDDSLIQLIRNPNFEAWGQILKTLCSERQNQSIENTQSRISRTINLTVGSYEIPGMHQFKELKLVHPYEIDRILFFITFITPQNSRPINVMNIFYGVKKKSFLNDEFYLSLKLLIYNIYREFYTKDLLNKSDAIVMIWFTSHSTLFYWYNQSLDWIPI